MGITFDALAAKKLLMAYFLRYGKYEGADMDCKTAQMMVTPYINRELKDRELEEFIDHIRDCKECYEELEIYFTIHFALRKLDEDKDVSFNIQKMLQDDLRLSERRVRRRKLARIISWVLMLVAELLLALMLITQFQMGPEGRVERTPLYRLFYGENQDQDGNPQEEPRPESEWEEQEKKKKKAPSESETSGNTARNAAGSVRSPGI